MSLRGAPHVSPSERPVRIGRRSPVVHFALIIVLAVAGAPAFGGPVDVESLAASVPAEAGFFIELDRLADRSAPERARSAAQLFAFLVGSGEAHRDVATDWRRALRRMGIAPGRVADALLSRRLAIASVSWKRLSEGVLIVRLAPGDDIIETTFPPDSMDTIDSVDGVIHYRHRNLRPLWAATDGRTLILSQKNGGGTLYDRAVKILAGGGAKPLASDATFERLVESLPRERDGVLFLRGANGPTRGSIPLGDGPAAVGILLREGGVELVLRTEGGDRGSPARGTRSALERMKSLPQTTLLSCGFELDAGAAFEDLIGRSGAPGAPAFVRLLGQMLDVETVSRDLAARLGPAAIVAWDQHLGAGPDIPQIAILMATSDARRCSMASADAVQAAVDWLDLEGRAPLNRRVRLSSSEYLGTVIYEVALPFAAVDGEDGGPVVTPAFAAIDEWFVVAAGADHIRNIADATWGMAPTLGELSEMRELSGQSGGASMLALAQPALAAQVVSGWLADREAPVRRWLDRFFVGGGSPPTVSARRTRLGIGMRVGGQPASVSVARVYAAGRAFGRLREGDLILGLNGRLLSINEPTRDLRRLVSSQERGSPWVFRVRREESVLDVVVPVDAPRRVSETPSDPLRALGQFQRLFESVEVATLRISPDSDGTSARLTLRFGDD